MRSIDADALLESLGIEPDMRCDVCKHKSDCQRYVMYTRNDICQMIDEMPTADGWISVEERLPEKNGRYLALDENGEVYSAEYEKNRPNSEWTDDYEGYIDMAVTHWMLLPSAEGLDGT